MMLIIQNDLKHRKSCYFSHNTEKTEVHQSEWVIEHGRSWRSISSTNQFKFEKIDVNRKNQLSDVFKNNDFFQPWYK